MSRVGKNPVALPDGVTLTITGNEVKVKGKLGELSYNYDDTQVEAKVEDKKVWVKPLLETKKSRSLWGTTRARISNLVEGVSNGYSKKLQIIGVGYRAKVQGSTLQLALGYSHDINFDIPQGIKVNCPTQTEIEISGADKQVVGQVASVVRGFRSPEPYKGKGIRYVDEYIMRKEGKKK